MPEKVGALTPLGVKSGKYNGTPNFFGGGGLKVVIFLATFTILLRTVLNFSNRFEFLNAFFSNWVEIRLKMIRTRVA